MTKIQKQCQNCHQTISIDAYQSYAPGYLVWSISSFCEHCGEEREVDGKGFPPDDLRQQVMAQEGEYSLYSSQNTQSSTVLIKSLRKHLHLTIAELNDFAIRLPFIKSGTRTEMEYLQCVLNKEGIISEIISKDG